MTKRFLFFIAALLCAASMWAGDNYKTWTMGEMRSLTCARNLYTSISYNSLDNTHWGTITYNQNTSNGRGYIITGSSPTQTMNAVFVLWSHDESVPSYTRRRCTWKFSLYTVSTKHHATMCLYGMPDNVDALKALPVDFTAHYDDHAGSEYLLAQTTNMRQDGSGRFADYYRTLDFDNRTGSTEQTKKWYIMTTHVTGSGNGKSDLDEWGKLFSDDWYNDKTPGYWYAIENLYYKYITFNANGGDGSMEEQVIENSANLTANTFTRTGFTFAGWATSANGAVVYTDGSEITATSDSKGPVTLYAKWTRNTYTIEYNLKGGTATNPSTYNVETATFTLTNPTKTDYTFLGWTGSNGDVPQTEVTISQGSTGNKTYKANWQFTTAYLIDAIPNPVVHTDACHDAIIAALGSYTGLSDEQKALMSAADLEKLQAAEAAYAVLDGAGIIRFVDKDDATIREHVMSLELPQAPEAKGFTFLYWQVVERNISDGTIRLQAVYEKNPVEPVENFEIDFRTDPYTAIGELPSSVEVAGAYHDNQHGYSSPVITLLVPAGNYKITIGNCKHSNDDGTFVKDETDQNVLDLIDKNGQTITSLLAKDNCYHQDPAKYITSAWLVATETQTINIHCPQYTPYIKFEKVESVPQPVTVYTVTFANADGATGIVPAAVEVGAGDGITLPANHTLYKEGYTLTGWNDGYQVHSPGSSFTPNANTTMTAEYTANTVSLADRTEAVTVKWLFSQGNGVPAMAVEGSTAFVVAQATIGEAVIDVQLLIDATKGKFQNQAGNWTQVNPGTIFTLPSAKDAVISYRQYDAGLVSTPEITVTSDEPTYALTAEGTNGQLYYEYIQAVYAKPQQPVETVTIYLVNTLDWTTVNAYVSTEEGDAPVAWPGEAMTKVDSNNAPKRAGDDTDDQTPAKDVYAYTFDVTYERISFNNGTEQTVNLTWSADKPYFVLGEKNTEGKYEGTWYASPEDIPTGGDDPGVVTDINQTNTDAQAVKLIRKGNVYILTEEFIYTTNGQKVK